MEPLKNPEKQKLRLNWICSVQSYFYNIYRYTNRKQYKIIFGKLLELFLDGSKHIINNFLFLILLIYIF
jgi:hypothetical protein